MTDLWLDDPYVLAAKKLLQWATEENEKGNVYPVSASASLSSSNQNVRRMLCCMKAASHGASIYFL